MTHPAQWDGLENILKTSTDRSLMTHPAKWDGLEGPFPVIPAKAGIQKYNQIRMEPRLREVDQGTGEIKFLLCDCICPEGAK